jgi:DNA-binding MarR family transcriptional regulator
MPSPSTVPRFYQLARLWIELTRQLHRSVAPELQEQFGSRTNLLLIGIAIYLGTIEGRPLTASKLAAYVGMPRASVIRRLRTLCRRGAVERKGAVYRTPADRLDRMSRGDHARLMRLVRTTAEELSR